MHSHSAGVPTGLCGAVSPSALRIDQMLSAGPFLILRVVATAIHAKQSAPMKATTSTPIVAALPCAHIPNAGNSAASNVVIGIAIVAAAHSQSRCTAECAAPQAKANHPQTNGICERFHKTILQEFYQVAFRRKIYQSIEELQHDLDDWMAYYNSVRTHQGKMYCGRTPMQTLIDAKKIWDDKITELNN